MENIPQQLANLPKELLKQPRFFPCIGKVPAIKEWNNPANQSLYSQIDLSKKAGFDTCGHRKAADYCLADFDHVLDDNGNFVNADARQWFNLLSGYETYCEKSISGQGLHFLFRPSPNKFQPISGGRRGTLCFGKDAKLEIFYLSKARYCLLTGNIYQCEPNTSIVGGELADDALQTVLDEIERRNPTTKPSARTPNNNHSDSAEYDLWRAEKMLDAINPADLTDSDWLAVISAAKTIGLPYSVVDAFNRRDSDKYDEKENLKRYDSVTDPNFNIATLHGIAKRFGYREADTRRQWYQLQSISLAPISEDKPEENFSRADFETADSELADNEFTAKFNEWQEKNGKINPAIVPELKNALEFMQSLSADTFTADTALDSKNLCKVALVEYYCTRFEAEKFFLVLEKAKKNAKERKSSKTNGLTAPLSEEEELKISALLNGVNDKKLRNTLRREVTTIDQDHKKFLIEQERALRREAEEQEMALRREAEEQERQERRKRLEAEEKRLDELRAQKQSPERDAEIIQLIRSRCEWRRDRQGLRESVKATAANADLIFTYDPNIDGLFGYDEFRDSDVFLKAPDWNKNVKAYDEWKDADDAQLRMYLKRTYKDFGTENLVRDIFTDYSKKRSFHEVKQYLESRPEWDGTERAATILIKFLRADDTPYVKEVTLNWLIAAVARIYYPGCDYQLAPILLGEQGIGKSHLLGKLGGKWYGTLVDSVDDSNHVFDAIQNIWLCEIKEMLAMSKADIRAQKSFIDAAADNRRKAYDRRAGKVKRHCVFVITTNDKLCLSDPTGNRRYPIITCHSKPRDYVDGLTDDYIDQIWAEVLFKFKELFKDGFDESKLALSKAAQIVSDEIAAEHTRDDLGEEISNFLDTKIPPFIIWKLLTKEERRNFFTAGSVECTEEDIINRQRSLGGRDLQADIEAIKEILYHSEFSRRETRSLKGVTVDVYYLYGSEYRAHICPAEIFAECFDKTDRRKSLPKILECLNKLDGWTQGKRLRNADPAYKDQKVVFYRENNPADTLDETICAPEFTGETVKTADVPPFADNPDKLPF